MNRRPSRTPLNPSPASRYRTTDPAAFLPPARKQKRRLGRVLLLVFVLLLTGNAVCNRFVFARRVQVPLTSLAAERDGYTLLLLSDLKGERFGRGQARLLSALSGQRFDAVVLAGDMVSALGNAQPLYELIEGLHALAPAAPIYFIAGDEDPEPVSRENAPGGSPYAPWVLGCMQRGAQLLSGPVCLTTEGEQAIWLAASADLTLDLTGQQTRLERLWLDAKQQGNDDEIDLAEYNLSRVSRLREAKQAMKANDICVAVTHVPPEGDLQEALRAPNGRPVDLLLAGHMMGGLVRLPGIGPLFVPSETLPRYGLLPGDLFNGLTKQGGTQLLQSAGLGRWDAHYPVFFRRLFNPPTVTLAELVPSRL